MYVCVCVLVLMSVLGSSSRFFEEPMTERFSVLYLRFAPAPPSSIKIIAPNVHSVLTL